MTDTRRELWTVAQTAEFLGQSEETVRRKLARGDLPGFRAGGKHSSWRVEADILKKEIRPMRTRHVADGVGDAAEASEQESGRTASESDHQLARLMAEFAEDPLTLEEFRERARPGRSEAHFAGVREQFGAAAEAAAREHDERMQTMESALILENVEKQLDPVPEDAASGLADLDHEEAVVRRYAEFLVRKYRERERRERIRKRAIALAEQIIKEQDDCDQGETSGPAGWEAQPPASSTSKPTERHA